MTQTTTDLDPGKGIVPRALFTADEIAKALSISRTLVRQLTTKGEIPCRRIGRLVRYTQADIDAFVDSRENHAL